MIKSIVLGILIAIALPAGAQEQQAYCQYLAEQAKAQRDLLRTPSALAGPIQPSTGTPPQMIVGVTESLSDLRKSSTVMRIAETGCDLYSAQSEAQKSLTYALPSIEKQVLQNRLALIQNASDQLDALIADNQKLVDSHELTRQSLYILETAKVRLDANRTDTLTGLTTPYVPDLSPIPLKKLVIETIETDSDNQVAQSDLAKESTWDIKVSGGAHYQISTPNQTNANPTGAYGEFSITYNFGKHAIDSHLDRAETAYSKWKINQFDNVFTESRVLEEQIRDTIEIQSKQLEILRAHEIQIDQNLDLLTNVDTSTSLAFKNQLLADKITLGVDIQDVQFRIAALQKYLEENF